jgi:SAM-dependent methyltransferase
MKDFWDARARENAEYFVDNRLDYNHGDEAFFWEQGAKDLDRMLELVGARVQPSDHVLDVGCGVGRLTRALAPRAARVTGLDISPEMVARARENLEGHDNVVVEVGDGISLRPLGDGSVDVVISIVVFQHIPDPRITLGYVEDMGRVLRPGGWAAFQVSNDPVVHSRDYPQPSRLKKLLGRAPKGQDDPAWRGSAVSLDDLRAAIDRGGMTLEAITGEGTQYCIVRTRRA